MRVPLTMRPPSFGSTVGARSVALTTLLWVVLAGGFVASASAASLRSVGLTVTSADVKSRTLTTKVTATRRLSLQFAVVRGGRTLATGSASVPKGTRTRRVRLSRKPTGTRLKLRITARYRDRSGRRRSGTGLIALPKRAPVAPTVNRAPTALALSAAAVAENVAPGTVVGVLAGTDPDAGDTLTYALVAGTGGADNLAFTLSGATLRTAVPLDAEAKSSYAVRVRVSDGRGGTFDRAFAITVTNVNETPGEPALSSSTVPENQAAGTVIGALSATDPDAGDTRSYTLVAGTGDGGNSHVAILGEEVRTAGPLDAEATPSLSIRVRVSDAGGLSSERGLTVTVSDVNETAPAILLSNSTVAENQAPGAVVGTLSAPDPDAGDSPAFSLVPGDGSTDNASFAVVGSQLRTAAVLDFESDPSRSVRLRADDGRGGVVEQPFTITVSDGSETPVIVTSAGSAAYTEQAAAVVIDGGLTMSDVDSPSLTGATVAISGGPVAGDELLFTDAGSILGSYSAGTGVLTLTGTATVAQYQAALQTVTFHNPTNDSPGTSRTIRFTAADATGPGLPATRGIAITQVNDAPVADDEAFSGANSAVGNTVLVGNDPTDGAPIVTSPRKAITADILDGDGDVDGPGPLAVIAGTFPSNDGGTVVVEADGDFTFTPAASTSCADTSDFFDYTVSDQAGATDVGRVAIAITGCVWYVSNNAPGNAGTSTAPFDTLAQAESASGTGHTIFVFDGDNTAIGYSSGIALKAGQRLLGEAATLQVGADVLATGVPASRPTISDLNADAVVLADGVTVGGINVDPQGAGGGIFGGALVTSPTIADVTVVDAGTPGTQPGLELDGTDGSTTISDLTVTTTGTAATAVRLNNAGTVTFASAGTISLTTTGTKALDAAGTNLGTSTFDDITVIGSSAGGVALTNTTGTTNLGDGLGTDLQLSTSSGAAAALALSNAGQVTIAAAGNDTVAATGGPAVDITGTAGQTFDLDSVSSTNSAGDGINLAGLGTGTFAAAGGAISGAAGIAFDLEGGSGTVTFAGALNNGAGATAEITTRSGGTVALSGAIADTADAGGGILVGTNTGGSTTFSNASKVISSGASDAVVFSNSDGHALTFSGGGLDIDTTSGKGVDAPSSGTLVVGGTANTIDTTTGRALGISNTDIGAAGVTFERISSNGAANGIVLNTTGASGRLVVTGNGGTCVNGNTAGCSGGRIAGGVGLDDSGITPVGTGIVLASTLNPSFTRMWLHDHSNYAIRGTGVAGLTLANSVINGANGTTGTTPFDDSSVWFDNLTGSAAVTDTYVAGGFEDNFRVVNTSGSLNRITFTNTTFGVNGTRPGNDALLLETAGTASQLQATVTGSTFSSAAGDLLQFNHGGTGAGDLVLSGNAFSNSHPAIATGGGGLSLFQSGVAGGNTTMTISGNSFRDAVGPGVLVVKSSGPATQTGTFTSNTIGVASPVNSGSAEGSALKLQNVDQGTTTWAVTNNTIRGYNNFGIEVLAGGGGAPQSGTVNSTITGNTITQPGTTASTITIPKQGIHLNIGTFPGDTFLACANIKTNTIDTSGADGVPATGVNVDVRLRQRQSTTIRLPGYGGASSDNTAVQTFINTNNSAGTSTLAANTVGSGGGGFTGTGTVCP